MKKVLYVVAKDDFSSPALVGVRKKVDGQCAAFARLGYAPTLLWYEKGRVFINDNQGAMDAYKKSVFMWKLGSYAHVIKKFFFEKKETYNLIYVRKSGETPFSIKAAKELRKHAEHIVYEIPTYPYDREILEVIKRRPLRNKIKPLISLLLDVASRKHLKKYIDCFAAITDQDECEQIFEAPAIVLCNGIDTESLPMRKKTPDETIVLVGTAHVNYWHGYDRLIKGMYEYYSKDWDKEVLFYIVGDGSYIDGLKNLTKTLRLDGKVLFHGLKEGVELDALLDKADLGVASLGLYRKKLSKTSELKIREYCARALPFIVSAPDIALPEDFPWMLRVPNNETSVCIKSVIDFHQICVDRQESLEEMREYARKNLSWDAQFKAVIDFVDLRRKT